MKVALRYGAILIGMGIVARYSTGAGRLLDKTTNFAVKTTRALQVR